MNEVNEPNEVGELSNVALDKMGGVDLDKMVAVELRKILGYEGLGGDAAIGYVIPEFEQALKGVNGEIINVTEGLALPDVVAFTSNSTEALYGINAAKKTCLVATDLSIHDIGEISKEARRCPHCVYVHPLFIIAVWKRDYNAGSHITWL